jgi:hypothetical protein
MFPSVAAMSNSTSLSTEEAASVSSGSRLPDHFACLNPLSVSTNTSSPQDHQHPQKIKKKRSLPGNPGNQLISYPLRWYFPIYQLIGVNCMELGMQILMPKW